MQIQSFVLVDRYLYSCDTDVVSVCLYLKDSTASGMKKSGKFRFFRYPLWGWFTILRVEISIQPDILS